MKSLSWRALACTAVLLAAVGAAAAPATSAPARTRTAPTVGTCYVMTSKQGAGISNTAKVVDCSTPHTARAISVFDVPSGIDMGDHDALAAQVAKKCDPKQLKVVGLSVLNLNLTTYTYFWFQPTKAQIASGDRTLECDLGLYGGKNHLATLPTDATPAVSGHPPYDDSVRKCVEIVGNHFYYTTCALKHQYRSTTDFMLSGKRYPSAKAFARADAKHCGAKGYSQNPTADEWKAGYHTTICLEKTSS